MKKTYSVTQNYGLEVVTTKVADIVCFESMKHYVQMVRCGGDPVAFREKLDKIESDLKSFHFVRIRKNTLVNLAHVCTFMSDELSLSNGASIKISRDFRRDALQQFRDYEERFCDV